MPNPHPPPKKITTRVLAEELGPTPDQVRRGLARPPDIKPRAYAGIARLFDNEAIARVRHEINKSDARGSGRKGVARGK
jgi:hypothetical protein